MLHYRVAVPDGVEIAMHRLPAPTEGRVGATPLLLAAGTFNGRNFWLGRGGGGVAHDLAAAGFDVWMLDLRGHGGSQRPSRWLLTDWIERDAPAAMETVVNETGAARAVWVGHSAGGVVGAAFSASAHAAAALLRRLVLVGTPGPGGLRGGRRWAARVLHAAAALKRNGRIPGELLKLGPEPESGALVHQWLGWNLAGAWTDPAGEDYLERLRQVRIPVLAVAGSGDALLAPPAAVRDLLGRFGSRERRMIVAGAGQGMSRDYNHGAMVLARSARDEIWPRVIEWLRSSQFADDPNDPQEVEQT